MQIPASRGKGTPSWTELAPGRVGQRPGGSTKDVNELLKSRADNTFSRFSTLEITSLSGGFVSESVSVDARRILLRYGAPIIILDNVSEKEQVKFARLIAKTKLPEREKRLKALLEEGGYSEPPE